MFFCIKGPPLKTLRTFIWKPHEALGEVGWGVADEVVHFSAIKMYIVLISKLSKEVPEFQRVSGWS